FRRLLFRSRRCVLLRPLGPLRDWRPRRPECELAEHDRIRVVEDASRVEDPGVVAERTSAGVAADERPLATEPARRHERVDRLGVPGGGAVRGSLRGTDAHERLAVIRARANPTAPAHSISSATAKSPCATGRTSR